MRRSKATAADIGILRNAIGSLQPGSAHLANEPPRSEEIFAPAAHSNALDPQRPLVVGNRGVGKSFWSSVLTHERARARVGAEYPRLALGQIQATLGFHEAAGKDEGPAPSPSTLRTLLRRGKDPLTIWRAVLIQALSGVTGVRSPPALDATIEWLEADTARAEAALRHADAAFRAKDETFLLVFDALDRLGTDWQTITSLTKGILQLALDMRGFRALKAKVFLRTDQSKDDDLFRFADASKIRSSAVNLVWRRGELFGLLYNILISTELNRVALSKLAGDETSSDMANMLLSDEGVQEELFYRLAGEFMGAGPKRGRTYNWLYDHLADTFGETSPRSFLTALQRAAAFGPAPKDTVIDHNGIRAGVQDASRVRVDQLKEDYGWIDKVMGALNGLEVPCDPEFFKRRWKDRETVAGIRTEAREDPRLLPLEIATDRDSPESALLQALENIGVVEFRDLNRINMPDIFRVEAGIKRRGGVRPPSSRRG